TVRCFSLFLPRVISECRLQPRRNPGLRPEITRQEQRVPAVFSAVVCPNPPRRPLFLHLPIVIGRYAQLPRCATILSLPASAGENQAYGLGQKLLLCVKDWCIC